ncbi:MAG: orotidine-5'-phosphate decarboxylase [Bacteroidota bacterium]
MSISSRLTQLIHEKQSFLCVGLDPDLEKFPSHLDGPTSILTFNKEIIKATSEQAVAYKLNLAFYECFGKLGWEILEETLALIPDHCLSIADAKRGDIGNTSRKYAEAFFSNYDVDSLTIAPYMGEDSVAPFLTYPDRLVFLLGLTSNAGARNFQYLESEGQPLYQQVISQAYEWGKSSASELGFVVGATHPEQIGRIRKLVPDSWLLVPGVGAQGGDLHAVCQAALNDQVRILINSSRGIIYAGKGMDYATDAQKAALALTDQMKSYI